MTQEEEEEGEEGLLDHMLHACLTICFMLASAPGIVEVEHHKGR